jgi:hypothetical protein
MIYMVRHCCNPLINIFSYIEDYSYFNNEGNPQPSGRTASKGIENFTEFEFTKFRWLRKPVKILGFIQDSDWYTDPPFIINEVN